MPTTPAPSQPLPDSWSSTEKIPREFTPLGQLNKLALDNLTLTVPSTVIDPDAPVQPMPCIDFRARLLRTSTPQPVRDRGWRHLAVLAQAHQGGWNTFALGMAFPGLITRAERLTAGLSFGQTVQVQFTMAIEFLFALHRPGVADKPWLLSRLVGAAYDQTSERKQRKSTALTPTFVDIDTIGDDDHPVDPWPQPDPAIVLDRLVALTRAARDGHRITEAHRELIARTYLDGDTLAAVAAQIGMSYSNASKQRTRAAALIARLLGRADLIEQPPSTP